MPDEQVAAALADQALHPSWLLAAEDGALTFPQFATPLLVATVAAVVLWVLLLLGVAFATRARGVDPGPATMRGDTIAVIRGDVAVSIRLQGDQVADRPAALRRLATTAAGRLAEPSTQAPASPEPA